MSARSLVGGVRPLCASRICAALPALPVMRLAPRILVAPTTPLAFTPRIGRTFTSSARSLSKDTSWTSRGTVKYSELKPETAAPSGEITIIDVREPNEAAQGIIPSAVNVPLSQFQKAFSGDGGDFLREFAFQRPAYDDKVIFYCRSGKRSQQALEFAQKNGWWNVRNYQGSWLDWVQQEEARGQASKVKEEDD